MGMGKKIARVMRETMAATRAGETLEAQRNAWVAIAKQEHARLVRMTVLACVALAGWAVTAWMLWREWR